jgi:hypothetical protein
VREPTTANSSPHLPRGCFWRLCAAETTETACLTQDPCPVSIALPDAAALQRDSVPSLFRGPRPPPVNNKTKIKMLACRRPPASCLALQITVQIHVGSLKLSWLLVGLASLAAVVSFVSVLENSPSLARQANGSRQTARLSHRADVAFVIVAALLPYRSEVVYTEDKYILELVWQGLRQESRIRVSLGLCWCRGGGGGGGDDCDRSVWCGTRDTQTRPSKGEAPSLNARPTAHAPGGAFAWLQPRAAAPCPPTSRKRFIDTIIQKP